jgi:hypothetical protein
MWPPTLLSMCALLRTCLPLPYPSNQSLASLALSHQLCLWHLTIVIVHTQAHCALHHFALSHSLYLPISHYLHYLFIFTPSHLLISSDCHTPNALATPTHNQLCFSALLFEVFIQINPLNFLVLRTICLAVERHSISTLAAHLSTSPQILCLGKVDALRLMTII